MTNDPIQPDVNLVIAELSIQVANLTRENAILKATIQAMQNNAKITDGGKLQQ